MWFRTPEKVCSSSYAARVCAAADAGALAIRTAVASAPSAALLQRREMLFGDRDLSIIPARSKSSELRKGGSRVVLLPHLLEHDAEIERRTRRCSGTRWCAAENAPANRAWWARASGPPACRNRRWHRATSRPAPMRDRATRTRCWECARDGDRR